ncbi:hypothetical protein CAL13_03935 [Bordetella genomosp. 9]|uniref:BON domain-containing protein n=2 Tax=Bordetella genomosp. 9 TaxID=1416803 RepID=A0A1W6Z584_9BORD|nr:hypothetical protein CAL13_03935 [Bordetella genomosp. 9]
MSAASQSANRGCGWSRSVIGPPVFVSGRADGAGRCASAWAASAGNSCPAVAKAMPPRRHRPDAACAVRRCGRRGLNRRGLRDGAHATDMPSHTARILRASCGQAGRSPPRAILTDSHLAGDAMKNSMVDTIVAAALGAAAMYYFDPELGRRRRAMLRDQLAGRGHDAERFLRRKARYVRGHLQGMAAQTRSAMSPAGEPASDRRIAERVRAAIGRAVSTPGAVDVNVAAGNVLLTGHILAAEREKLVSTVSAVEGVERVTDQMSAYDDAGNVPELQGASKV